MYRLCADDFSVSPTALPSSLFALCSKNLLLPIHFPINGHGLTRQGKAVVSELSCQGMLYTTTAAEQLPPSSPQLRLPTCETIPSEPEEPARGRCLSGARRNRPRNFVTGADTGVQ